MNNEIFALSVKTLDMIWGDTKTCDDNNNTFEIVRLGNPIRNRIYRLINKKLISSKCFSDNDCALDDAEECNIFDFVSKNSESLNLRAYLTHVNNNIFRVVNSFDDTRIFGPEYKIFSPNDNPLLYEHQCFKHEKILIKNVHQSVKNSIALSMQTIKTGKCGIFSVEDMNAKLKQMVQEVIPDLVNNTTSSMLDFFSTTTTESTRLNYNNNYGMINYNSTNSTDTSNYDAKNTHDNTMLVNGLILASVVTLTASMTYLLTRMYNKYCTTPIAQLETSDPNISDPNLMEMNSQKVQIYYTDSSSNGQDYAIVDISSKKAKYTKTTTYDSSNPSSTHSDNQEKMDLISSTDNSTQDNININSYRLAISSANKTDDVDMSNKKKIDKKSIYDNSHPSTSHYHIYETIDKITDQGYATDSSTHDNVNLKTYSRVALNQESHHQHMTTIQFNFQPYDVSIDTENKGAAIPIYDDCGPAYDRPPPLPRPVTVIENPNFNVPVEQYHDDSNLLGLSELPC